MAARMGRLGSFLVRLTCAFKERTPGTEGSWKESIPPNSSKGMPVVALLLAAAVAGATAAPSDSASSGGIAFTLSDTGVNYVVTALLPVVEGTAPLRAVTPLISPTHTTFTGRTLPSPLRRPQFTPCICGVRTVVTACLWGGVGAGLGGGRMLCSVGMRW
jgi:hypothetical protein